MTQTNRTAFIALLSAIVCASFGMQQASWGQALSPLKSSIDRYVAVTAAGDRPLATSIDQYVAMQDDAYRWDLVSDSTDDGVRTVVVNFVSQSWLRSYEVSRQEWQHHLVVTIPEAVDGTTGLLYVGGGSNNDEVPAGSDAQMVAIAKATRSVVAVVHQVPNQPLVFHNELTGRYEDDLIGYAWNQALSGGKPEWLPRHAMVKSVVRAMDTLQTLSSRENIPALDRFVVAGASKRGWTTWLTGAVDDRVIGIIPIVIDVLNVQDSMAHHFAAYGYWAPAVGDYVGHAVMEKFGTPRMDLMMRLIDPYHYRHRLTMPKLIINSTGDQFFLPDSSQFYYDALRGENYLRYVPNTDHSLAGSDALESVIAFHTMMAQGIKPPQLSWITLPDNSLQIFTTSRPSEVLLWRAHNPRARDFRAETLGRVYTSEEISPIKEGLYAVDVPAPASGWTAYFVEFTFNVGAAVPLKLTTNVRVVPDIMPYAGKPMDLPSSVTMLCRAYNEESAAYLADEIRSETRDIRLDTLGDQIYVHWSSLDRYQDRLKAMRQRLEGEGCADFFVQYESGDDVTFPPHPVHDQGVWARVGEADEPGKADEADDGTGEDDAGEPDEPGDGTGEDEPGEPGDGTGEE